MATHLYMNLPRSQMQRRPYRMPWPAVPELSAMRRLECNWSDRMPAQYHPDRIEINFIERGGVSWWSGPDAMELVGGDVWVSWPDEPHGSLTGAMEAVDYYAVTMRLPKRADAFLGLPVGESQALLDALWGLPRKFRATQQVAEAFRQAHTTSNLPVTDLNGAAMRGHLVALLTEIVAAGRQDDNDAHPGGQVARAMTLMQVHLSEPLDLEAIARAVGWSLPHFKERFRKETGTTPARHYLRLRVFEGIRRIACGGQSVTRVAHALGFSSSQYFATCVRRFTRQSPSAFAPRRDTT